MAPSSLCDIPLSSSLASMHLLDPVNLPNKCRWPLFWCLTRKERIIKRSVLLILWPPLMLDIRTLGPINLNVLTYTFHIFKFRYCGDSSSCCRVNQPSDRLLSTLRRPCGWCFGWSYRQCRYKAVSFTGLKPYGDLKRLFGSRVFNLIPNDVVLVANHFPAFLRRVINAHQVLDTCIANIFFVTL